MTTTKQRLKEAIGHHKAGKRAQAARIYQTVLDAEPENADALHLLGVVDYEEARHEDSRRRIAAAMELKPDDPFYHHNYGAVLSLMGDLAAAEGHYREALRLKPDYAEAIYNLAAIIKLRHDDPLLGQIKTLLRKKNLKKRDKCFLHFAAGKFYDDIGKFADAFGHIRQGNRAKGARFDPRKIQRYSRALMDVFDRDFLAARFQRGLKSESPVFVVGMPRSGTSLIEQILASHSQVFGAGELQDISAISRALKDHDPRGRYYPNSIDGVPDPILRGLAKSYLERTRTLAPGARRIVNKMPLNFWHLGLIVCMFPRARIIHCMRDPLDTCLSCYFQNFTEGQEFSFDLGHLGKFYRGYETVMEHWRNTLPVPFLEVRYEDLVADPVEASRQLVAFCGLDWEEACAQSHKTRRPVQTASRWQVRQPVYKTSVKRWQRYERHLAPLMKELQAEPAATGETG